MKYLLVLISLILLLSCCNNGDIMEFELQREIYKVEIKLKFMIADANFDQIKKEFLASQFKDLPDFMKRINSIYCTNLFDYDNPICIESENWVASDGSAYFLFKLIKRYSDKQEDVAHNRIFKIKYQTVRESL